jgi:hypothetical protein
MRKLRGATRLLVELAADQAAAEPWCWSPASSPAE